MQIKRTLAGMLIAVTATLGLTACDPPMPPDVAAQLAEQSYSCVEGEAAVSSEPLLYDVAYSWADSLSYACVDPEPAMTFSVSDVLDAASAIQLTSSAPSCQPVQTLPIGVDAGVIVYTQSELGGLSLSMESIAGILEGKITNWSELANDNPGYELPDMPIELLPEADAVALSALTSAVKLSNVEISDDLVVTPVDSPSVDLYSAIPEGAMAVVPSSYASYLGLTAASIYLGFDEELQEPIIANADLAGIQSASTQWKFAETETGISVQVDPTVDPLPAEGFDTADNPYQAIYPVNFYMCSSDELVSRAIGRFMLRLDSQGALAGSYYAPLPEAIRIASLVRVSAGLPTPAPVE